MRVRKSNFSFIAIAFVIKKYASQHMIAAIARVFFSRGDNPL